MDFACRPMICRWVQWQEKSSGRSHGTEFAGQILPGHSEDSIIRTNMGKTIMLQHDVSSPRPYSRSHLISGTKGVAQKIPGAEDSLRRE